MQRCRAMTLAPYPVGSDTSDKVYQVRLWVPGELPTCTCTGFMTKRNKIANQLGGGGKGAGAGLAKSTAAWCKHLSYVEGTVCHWEQKSDSEYSFDGTCPKCGGPVVDDRGVEIVVSDDAALADLLALRDELAGEPVAVPTAVQTVQPESIPTPADDGLAAVLERDLARIRGEKLSPEDAAAALIKEMS